MSSSGWPSRCSCTGWRPSCSDLGRDQLRALAVLRYWFGDLELLAVVNHPAPAEVNRQSSLFDPDPAAVTVDSPVAVVAKP
jgi:hypothetical protein